MLIFWVSESSPMLLLKAGAEGIEGMNAYRHQREAPDGAKKPMRVVNIASPPNVYPPRSVANLASIPPQTGTEHAMDLRWPQWPPNIF